jgi:hypothetical protein
MDPSISQLIELTDKYVDAATPGEAIAHAIEFSPSWVLIRPSERSFTHWVAVFYFASEKEAKIFANEAKTEYNIPYCITRKAGNYWVASVPVAIREIKRLPGDKYEWDTIIFDRMPYRLFEL